MSQYGELLKQLEELDRRIEEAKHNEYEPALDEVLATTEAFGFSPTEVFGLLNRRTGKSRRGVRAGRRALQYKCAKSMKSKGADSRQTQMDFA